MNSQRLIPRFAQSLRPATVVRDKYSAAAAGLLPTEISDITGNMGTGKGAGKRPLADILADALTVSADDKAKTGKGRFTPARRVARVAIGKGARKYRGDGQDIDAERAAELAEQAARLPWIADAIIADGEVGANMVRIGKRGAEAAARYVGAHKARKRSTVLADTVKAQGDGFTLLRPDGVRAVGVEWLTVKPASLPSSTSIEEAGQAATVRLVVAIKRHLASGRAIPFDRQRVRFFLGGLAWRAALASLRRESKAVKGRNQHTQGKAVSLELHASQDSFDSEIEAPLSASELQIAGPSLQAWARGEVAEREPLPMSAHESAKREASAWVWDTLVRPVTFGLSARERQQGSMQTKVNGAKRRAVLLIRLMHGDSFFEASNRAGFASATAAAESLRAHKVFDELASQSAELVDRLPDVQGLRVDLRQAGRRAGRLHKAQSQLVRMSMPATPGRYGLPVTHKLSKRAFRRDYVDIRNVDQNRLQFDNDGNLLDVVLFRRQGKVAFKVQGRFSRALSMAFEAWIESSQVNANVNAQVGDAIRNAKLARSRLVNRRTQIAAEFRACVKRLFTVKAD